MNEHYERVNRCVVCCVKIEPDGKWPNYCDPHGLHDDPSMPPIPMQEWWPVSLPSDPLARFMTGKPIADD